MEKGARHAQRIREDERLIGADELEDISTQVVCRKFSEGIVETDGSSCDFECNVNDSKSHDAHGIGMLSIVRVE